MKPNKTVKDLKEIDKNIEDLKHKRKKLLRKNKMVYCPICKKYYPEEKCRSGIELEGGIVSGFPVTCPKGHEWDEKH